MGGRGWYVRRATKWGKTGDNQQWCETWNEDYGSDGRTDKTAYKWATLADGEVCQHLTGQRCRDSVGGMCERSLGEQIRQRLSPLG